MYLRHQARKTASTLKPLSFRGIASEARKPLTNILIANRGEIALRVGRTASQHGIRVTTIYTDPDANSQHALSSPFSVNLGVPSAYLDGDKIIAAAKQQGCNGVHPGYGFLSENSEFARKCSAEGLTFIGPPWEAIEAMGNKSRSKEIMTAAGVPCIPGYHGRNQDPDFLEAEAAKIGFPVLIKAVKGGGGKGMRIAMTQPQFQEQLRSAKAEAMNSFGDEVMLVEKYITTPRHIEVQVFADKFGNCVALGERDCSIQRRHQKILEESPAPHLDETTRQDLWAKARAAALAVKYEGAGTVEFIFDNETGEFFFMEMNTRLQVEHPATEMVTGEDLVHWQLIVAEGGELPLNQAQVEARIAERGHAIEARIYAENPAMNFIPDSGRLLHLRTPATNADVRIDAGFVEGDEISAHYDPMIAKLIVRGQDRREAIDKLKAALEEYEIVGPATNVEFLKTVCGHNAFLEGEVETGFIQKHHDALFQQLEISNEVYVQAALGLLLAQNTTPPRSSLQSANGINAGYQKRTYQLSIPGQANDSKPTAVSIRQLTPTTFAASLNGKTFDSLRTEFSPSEHTLTVYFPHTRLSSRVVLSPSRTSLSPLVTLFSQGSTYTFQPVEPSWLAKALGTKEATNSVLTPMPCKVLKVEVEAGQQVRKDQRLVVVESMKMEMVIRAPADATVKRVVHGEGEMCKAGTALVEFEEVEKDA